MENIPRTDSTEFHVENLWKTKGAQVIRLKLTKAQTAKLEAAKPSDKAAFLMGYAQRHPWPKGERWSLVVSFCDYHKATKAGQAIGLLDRKRKLKASRKRKPTTKPTNQ